jgi:hypothetical protein
MGSIPGQSMWDLWWTKWHWDRFFPEYFGFPLSISLHYTEKLKINTNQLHHRVAQPALRLRCARSICCGALHHRKKAQRTLKLSTNGVGQLVKSFGRFPSPVSSVTIDGFPILVYICFQSVLWS